VSLEVGVGLCPTADDIVGVPYDGAWELDVVGR